MSRDAECRTAQGRVDVHVAEGPQAVEDPAPLLLLLVGRAAARIRGFAGRACVGGLGAEEALLLSEVRELEVRAFTLGHDVGVLGVEALGHESVRRAANARAAEAHVAQSSEVDRLHALCLLRFRRRGFSLGSAAPCIPSDCRST